MCIICTKPTNVLFPSKETLQNCFDNNDDGAGFMYVKDGNVHIRKGFAKFDDFYDALNRARALTGDDVPYVMHFRIATQGYNKECTHPFPLSSKMDNLKKLKCTCSTGIAHNGIISLTSDHRVKDHSDTMTFIAEYLSLIIDNLEWYKDSKKKALVEKLMDADHNKLAILNKEGSVVLLGKGWIHDKKDNCYYSNSSYSYKRVSFYGNYSSYGNFYDAYDDYSWPIVTKKTSTPTKKAGVPTHQYGEWLKKWYPEKSSTTEEKKDWYKERKAECAPSKQDTTVQDSKSPVNKEAKRHISVFNWEEYKRYNNEYAFSTLCCPYTEESDDSYCTACANKKSCAYVAGCMAM